MDLQAIHTLDPPGILHAPIRTTRPSPSVGGLSRDADILAFRDLAAAQRRGENKVSFTFADNLGAWTEGYNILDTAMVIVAK